MEDFIFHEGSLPSGYRLGFEEFLFHQKQHRALQSPDGWHSFHAFSRKDNEVAASIHFHIDGALASASRKSPFGTVAFTDSLPPKALFEFLLFVEERLTALNVKKIVIKNYPALYNGGQAALITTFLFNRGYTVTDAEAGAVIEIKEGSFESQLHAWEKRKLKKSISERLFFRELSADRIGEIYLFILGCRKQKGHSLSMTLIELKDTLRTFPDAFALFGVFREETMVAASVAVRVNGNILYNFYSAHHQEFDAISPVVFLTEGIYGWCQRNKISLLDLGTSAVNGQPNFSLLDFKFHLGATPTTKLTFEKVLP